MMTLLLLLKSFTISRKVNEALEIKAGVIEGNVVSAEEINTIASLPSREGLLSMLVSVLQAPMRNFAMLTKAVAEQKAKSITLT